MNSEPVVTIIAVCYNQEKYVEATLNSIQQQTYQNIQLIIADDASTDGSQKNIQQWIEKSNLNAIFISHEKNMGLTKNINSTLQYIKGAFYQVFGCDDIMLPDKIERQVKLLQQHTEVDIVYSDMFLIDGSGKLMEQSYFEKHVYKQPKSGWLYKDLIERFIISAPSVLIRRNVIDELYDYNESLDYEDQDFFLRAAKKHQFIYMPEKTVQYRITGESLSTKRNDLKFFKNSFLIFFLNFDGSTAYKSMFEKKLIFYAKNLYSLRFKYSAWYFIKAFFKTFNMIFVKYSIASIPFLFQSKEGIAK